MYTQTAGLAIAALAFALGCLLGLVIVVLLIPVRNRPKRQVYRLRAWIFWLTTALSASNLYGIWTDSTGFALPVFFLVLVPGYWITRIMIDRKLSNGE